MRVGNASMATPSKFYTKLTEDDLVKLKTKALLTGDSFTNDDYQSFLVTLPTWTSQGKPEKDNCLKFQTRPVHLIYVDDNSYSTKPGVMEKWIVRIYH